MPAGSKTEKLVVNTDFAPTFADLAGVSFPADGRSLKPLLRGEDPSWRSAILLERLPIHQSDEKGGGKAKAKGKGKGKAKGKTGPGGQGGPGGSPPFEVVRTETYKYIEYENGDSELYDLKADPYELNSTPERTNPSVVEEDLKTRLDALKSCSEAGCRQAENAP